jgi:hypothetical protein
VIERVEGVMLGADDAAFLIEMFEQLRKRGLNVAGRLADFEARLRKACANVSSRAENSCADVSKVGEQQDSGHAAPYDLVDSGEAARILGCTSANVRDLARRGTLPRHRAGRGWVYPAASVIALSEKRAAGRR